MRDYKNFKATVKTDWIMVGLVAAVVAVLIGAVAAATASDHEKEVIGMCEFIVHQDDVPGWEE